MKIGIPSSPFSLWEKVRMRAIKSFLAFSYFRVLVATSMDDSERSRRISALALDPHRVERDRSRIGNDIRVDRQSTIRLARDVLAMRG